MEYDQSKHDVSTNFSAQAARLMLPYIVDLFHPKSYLELGAGYCHWAKVADELKISEILAVDGSWTDLSKIMIDKSLFQVHDFAQPLVLNRKYDLAICLEVGEHVETSASQTLVRSLVKHSDLVVFGAATPLQGGFMHINEQWQSYWQAIFREEGYTLFDILRPKFWNDERIIYYYRQNPFVYVRASRRDLVELCEGQKALLAADPIVDFIHPRKYLEMAGYDVVLMKHLIKKLPGHLAKTAARKLGISR